MEAGALKAFPFSMYHVGAGGHTHGTCHIGCCSRDAIFLGSGERRGKTLGKSVSDLAAKFIETIRVKFKDAGTEGLLTRAETHPTQRHIDTVQDELVTQMEEDAGYAAQLQVLVDQLQAAGVVRQAMASGLEVEETLEAGAMTQTVSGGAEVEQHMLTDVKAKNITIGDMTQQKT